MLGISLLKCYEYKGYGYTKADDLGMTSKKEKSYVMWSENNTKEYELDKEELGELAMSTGVWIIMEVILVLQLSLLKV